MRPELGDHAVVLGASMAGLLATRVLADAYRRVTVIDRDTLPESGMHRRGVPQGRHQHGLHSRGCAVLDALFPGFTAHAVRAGASLGDALGHCRWLLSGHRLRQADIGLPTLIASRPFLEGQIRSRVQALPGVTFLERTDIVGVTTIAGRRVTGVEVRDREGGFACAERRRGRPPHGHPRGILGDRPSTDPAGFEAFAASLPFPDISEAIAGAQSLDNPVAFRFPASVRRSYEHLRHFPDGLLVIGDAVCSLNPVYGQGMTVAANQALVLRGLLAYNTNPAPDQYFEAIAKTIDPPWNFAVGADLAFPGVSGPRTIRNQMVNAYQSALLAAASSNVVLGAAFLRVMGLLDRSGTATAGSCAASVVDQPEKSRTSGRARCYTIK